MLGLLIDWYTTGWLTVQSSYRAMFATLFALGSADVGFAAPGDAPPYAQVFEQAFNAGFAVDETSKANGETQTRHIDFKTFEIGKLVIRSGQIAAADPFVNLERALPFTQAVPNCACPVRLAVGFHPAGDVKDNRVAFARVDFSSEPVVHWTMARVASQNFSDLKDDDQIFGYGVDSGTGAFFDATASAAAKAMTDANPDVWNDWQTEGEANGPKIIGPHAFVLMLPMGDVNVAMFHSGWGDGFYASYFGYDASGNVAALLTDFTTIDWANAKW